MKNIYFKLSWLMIRFCFWFRVLSIHCDSLSRRFQIKAIMSARISPSDKILMLSEIREKFENKN